MSPQDVEMDSNVTRFEWKTSITPGKSIASGAFFIKNEKNFYCNITMKLTDLDEFEIIVKKSYYAPANARITVSTEKGTPIVENTDNWRDSFKFPKVSREAFTSFIPTSRVTPSFSFSTGINTSNPIQLPKNTFGVIGGTTTAGIGSGMSMTFGQSNTTTTPATPKIYDMTIICKIEWFGFVNDTQPLINFQKGLGDLYLKTEFSDLELQIDSTVLPVHKIVLYCQSKRFAMLIGTDVKTIEVTDVDLDTMKEVLKYMYSGETTVLENTEVAIKILAASAKYRIDELTNLCVTVLLKNLSSENALDILEVAYKNGVENLYKKILQFVAKNKDKISLKNFKDLCFTNSELMYEFMLLVW